MSQRNLQITLAKRPVGWVKETDFTVIQSDIPKIGSGEVLVRNHWLSLDPYMRGRMDDGPSYAAPAELGAVMIGGTVGEVVESNNAKFSVGDQVVGYLGWQQFAASTGVGLAKIDTRVIPASAYLGAVGMPGVAAWLGMTQIAEPKPGETVVVSAASGAVGSIVGQIAKFKGCRAVGVAGGVEKCRYVVGELGFDACVDYKLEDFEEALEAATPKGIDVYFENVGGKILESATRRLNPFARIPLCGLISQYNELQPHGLNNLHRLLINRVRLQGFVVSDRLDLWPAALKELGGWVAVGKLKYKESVVEGIERAPRAFVGMLRGENFGKQLVKLVQ